MSMPHHGDKPFNFDPLKDQLAALERDARLIERFQEQQGERYKRTFPEGRLGATDDGDITFAVAADPRKGVVVIEVPHPTTWIALPADKVDELIELLAEKAREVRGVKA